jgi:hypothetical protein
MATTNILVETFPGISSTRTIAFSLPSTSTTTDLLNRISTYLPENLPAKARLIVTTTSNKQILHSPTTTLADITHNDTSSRTPTILPLRLSLPLCGGKGGFGSQLRAAGGRMSSKKKRNAEPANSSSRNLDGRRLRTVAEAKSLATYLATKPEMDRREKDERRKRWEGVVEMAEVRGQEIKEGRGVGRGKGVSDEWVADKEEVADGVKSAVRKAMMAQEKAEEKKGMGKEKDVVEQQKGESSGSAASEGGSEEDSEEDVMELDEQDMERLNAEAAAGDVDAIFVLKNQVVQKPAKKPTRFAGFDSDDDEFLSSSDEEDSSGKGKAKQEQRV